MIRNQFGLHKIIVLVLTALLYMLSIGSSQPADVKEEFLEEKEFGFGELPDNDTLLMDYMDQQFFGDKNADISEYGVVGDTKLTDANEKKIYRELKASVERIADGTKKSTVIEVSRLSMNMSVWEKSVRKVMSYLMMDCPYDLYWFDKNSAFVSVKGYGSTINTVTISFTVALEYRGSGVYITDSAKIGAARSAVSNAKSIVAKHAGESDREKT